MQISEAKASDHYHHGDVRRALIGRAINIIESEGEAALTMRRIARDAGVSQAAPYSHFKNKTDLLTAVCVEGTVWFGDCMKARAAGKQGLEYLAGLAVGHVQFALEHPALLRLMSTRPISESLDAQGNLPEIFNEGYQLMLSGLAAAPLKHFGSDERQLDAPIAWVQIYGISNLLIEGRINPETFDFDNVKEFVNALLGNFLHLQRNRTLDDQAHSSSSPADPRHQCPRQPTSCGHRNKQGNQSFLHACSFVIQLQFTSLWLGVSIDRVRVGTGDESQSNRVPAPRAT